jgi:aspartate carbamoyltransferase catalytic subunit
MAKPALSLLDLKNVSSDQIHLLFEKAQKISVENLILKKENSNPLALVFLEPSTRTRISFEVAAKRLGMQTVSLLGTEGTSLEKGESFEDTLLNIDAMKPAAIILRASDQLDFKKISSQLSSPVISGGWGMSGHPTQALLDALTIKKFRGRLNQERILFIGDSYHSRVVSSHLELAKTMNYEVGLCGPASWSIKNRINETSAFEFSSLAEGLAWATVVIALRVQLERHSEKQPISDYHGTWGLNSTSLKKLSAESLILHPGPVNHGVEIESTVFQDSRCRILQQVTQGVYLRQALLHTFIEEPGGWL